MKSSKITRRRFLKGAAAVSAVSQSSGYGYLLNESQSSPQPSSSKDNNSLVCIFMRGGADFLNILVPYGDKNYEANRPTLAMKLQDGLIKLDSTFGLHPSFAPLESLYRAGKFAPIVCAGSHHRTRSHFDAQDWMEFGVPGDRTVREGWLNRYLSSTHKESHGVFRALATQELLPRSLRGTYPVLAVPQKVQQKKAGQNLDSFERFYGDSSEMMDHMMNGPAEDASGVVESGRITIETLRRYREIVGEASRRNKRNTISGSSYPSSKFGERMKQIALVLKANEGLEVAGVDYGGWDDHTRQGTVEGNMSDRLSDFARGLSAFCSDLGPALDRTTILVMTEFGRTVRENGNNGTDHGHGSGMLVIGGQVKGGQVHGDWTGLAEKDLYQGRGLAVTTDFRDVYYTVLANHFGHNTQKGFFGDYRPRELTSLY